MSLEEATWHSINVVYAQLDLDVGPENVTQTAARNGDRSANCSRSRRRRSAVSPTASRRSNRPTATRPSPTAASTTTRPRSAKSNSPTARSTKSKAKKANRALTPGQAYDVTNVLKGVITAGHRRRLHQPPCCSEVAGKTGTSEEESDAWFVGYTPEFSTAVWVGHPHSRETTGFGGPTAGPIWRDYMEAATAGECPAFETPETLPELSALTGGHTASGSVLSHSAGREFEEEEFEEGLEAEERRRRRRRRRARRRNRRSPGRRSPAKK